MERRKKLAVVAVILGAGIAGSLEYRKIGPSQPAAPTSGSPWRSESLRETDGNSASASAVARQPASGFSSGAESGSGEPASYGPGASAATVQTDPSAGDVSGQASGNLVNPLRSSEFGTTGLLQNPLRPQRIDEKPSTPLIDADGPETMHTIVDGDTLIKLSARYLGSADRYLELYQSNRDVLKDPDVLPIGMELRIPKRTADAETLAAAAAAVPITPLTPLTPLPRAGDPAGIAQQPASPASPQQPAGRAAAQQSAARGNTQQQPARNYKVQPGDNLIDIARKLYGDGAKYQALLDANRNVLRGPGDLKSGMVLVVP